MIVTTAEIPLENTRIAVLLMTLVGYLYASNALRVTRKRQKDLDRFIAVEGMLLSSNLDAYFKARERYPTASPEVSVRYAYRVDDTTFTNSTLSILDEIPNSIRPINFDWLDRIWALDQSANSAITVWYDPENPARSVLFKDERGRQSKNLRIIRGIALTAGVLALGSHFWF